MAHRATAAIVIAGALALATSRASAHDAVEQGDYIPTPPKAFEGLGVTEMLGARLPLATPFRDDTGKSVVLGDYYKDDLPVILTFNYSDCPMLCSQQLSALVQTLGQMDYVPGTQFRLVTIDLDSRETPHKIGETKRKYIERLPEARRAAVAKAWTFLVARGPADDDGIKAVADAVGFHYKYQPDTGQYAHPAALIFTSSRGMVTRYMGGIDYPPDVVRASIVLAGLSETATTSGFILQCFHYEPKDRARVAIAAMRIGAVAFIVLFFSALGLWRVVRRARPGVVRS